MGASASTDTPLSKQQKEIESQAASTGALPLLQKSFSNLLNSNSQSQSISISSLEQWFSLKYEKVSCEGAELPECFTGMLDQISRSIIDTVFVSGDGEISWVEFLKGYVSCCGRIPASSLLNILFRVVSLAAQRAGFPFRLSFDSDEIDGKINGCVSPPEFAMLLWVCWIMSMTFRERREDLCLPDLRHLLLSAFVSCSDHGNGVHVWDVDVDVFSLQGDLCVEKIYVWALRTVPNLVDSFSRFVNARLKRAATLEQQPNATGTTSRSAEDMSCATASESHILTNGRAWAISLSQRNSLSEEILRICFPCDIDVTEESLLYRSYVHGKGLNRFWSNVEGYHGPLLLLISASSGESSESTRKWIIGALTPHGFENKDAFYGTGGCLLSISPVFNIFSTSGKEHNYLYSHLHPAVRVYEARPKPIGLAFGGRTGNERIFIDEDFAKVTIRHHAVDKTYQPGSLFPDQGFLPVEASVLEVEVWGLGGKTAKQVQISYKRREELFTEQRRKVDLKTFGNWEDSPEKMMMDMISDPNMVRREDR